MQNNTKTSKESLLSTVKPSKAIINLAVPATLALLAKAVYKYRGYRLHRDAGQ